MFEVEGLAPERRHYIEIDTVDENAVDDEGHGVIVAPLDSPFPVDLTREDLSFAPSNHMEAP